MSEQTEPTTSETPAPDTSSAPAASAAPEIPAPPAAEPAPFAAPVAEAPAAAGPVAEVPEIPYSDPATEVSEEPKKSGAGKTVVAVVVVLLLVGVFAVLKFGIFNDLLAQWQHDVSTAKVNDCISQWSEKDIDAAKVVDCSSADAASKVVGVVENKTEKSFNDDLANGNPCLDYSTATSAIWVGTSSKGKVFCLAPVK